MELVSVAALAENRVIGRDDELPWSIPEDRQQYRSRIADNPVILGRITFESMLEDLPGSIQIVMSRSDREYDLPAAFHADSVTEAIEVASFHDAEVAYVIGGWNFPPFPTAPRPVDSESDPRRIRGGCIPSRVEPGQMVT